MFNYKCCDTPFPQTKHGYTHCLICTKKYIIKSVIHCPKCDVVQNGSLLCLNDGSGNAKCTLCLALFPQSEAVYKSEVNVHPQ